MSHTPWNHSLLLWLLEVFYYPLWQRSSVCVCTYSYIRIMYICYMYIRIITYICIMYILYMYISSHISHTFIYYILHMYLHMYVHMYIQIYILYVYKFTLPTRLSPPGQVAGSTSAPHLCNIHCLAPALTQETPVTRIGIIF